MRSAVEVTKSYTVIFSQPEIEILTAVLREYKVQSSALPEDTEWWYPGDKAFVEKLLDHVTTMRNCSYSDSFDNDGTSDSNV
jgi:hypothetical protein